jgi:hypothetical protein
MIARALAVAATVAALLVTALGWPALVHGWIGRLP